ncbi:MAG: UDP-N-acetylmuramate:L-alanyl-gamma-D-glutamyl-meso-diaminopimelate ligase [Gemmatimonadetes bacterium]|jgi:UDP-N-acetylmuramate: L-alanyl-gamma-D-glutamyl-meso-diaminopimelate ligase|nr:UDP-N-acetylmuramate:L-alanyl-gamma-D-glutamyl-meso-diaminopimelate ligase [Gemmatimonadota bacterium]
MSDDNGNVLSQVEPGSIRRIHLIGVAGTGMGSFAGMLKAAGYEVTGSDESVYPPMSDMLAAWGVEAMSPYSPANLDAARPDLVIVGNVIRRVNPEATAVRERGIPSMSFPAAFGALVLAGRHSVVIAGTHGKTTTSALMSHVLVSAGTDPSFLVGGVTLNYAGNFRNGKGEFVVVEGDEYDTAYFDKGPKFMHYRARTAMLTSVEFDHADIYRDMAHYESAYEKFAATLPDDGFLAVAASYPNAVALARKASKAFVATYAAQGEADYSTRDLRFGPEGARFTIVEPRGDAGEFLLPMSGHHNVENALGVYALSRSLGLRADQVRDGFASFTGVKRRQEIRGEPGGVLVIDDFAHHPTAVRETITAIRLRYPSRRLWAVFEPRSNTSRRNIHQQEYAKSFDGASRASIRVPEPHDKVPIDEQLDIEKVVAVLNGHGIQADASPDTEVLVRRVIAEAAPGDVVLVMSNGSFGGFIPTLLAGLERRFR